MTVQMPNLELIETKLITVRTIIIIIIIIILVFVWFLIEYLT